MAKAKKEAVPKKDKPSGQPRKPPEKKASSPGAASGGVFVDTNLAAQSAARLLAARVSTKSVSAEAPARPESAMFRHLKDGLAKPASQTISNLLDKHGGPEQKKSSTPFGAGPQVGRNQTFGADVNRSGVPRRTGGG